MKTNTHILRRETFGGTLFETSSGQRSYINQQEFAATKSNGTLPCSLRQELGWEDKPVHVVEPSWLPDSNFSAPDTVFFEVTRACNLRCTICFNSSGVKLNDELSLDERMDVVQDLANSGVQEIRFTGGEPLALPGINDLLAKASGLGLRVSLGTNAMLIDEARAQQLAKLGVCLAVVSIDGLQEKHDAIRGKGGFEKSLAGLEHLQSAGVNVRVNAVVMRSSLDDIPQLVDFFFQRGISMYLRRLIPSGRATNASTEMLTATEYEALKEQLSPYLSDPRGLISGHYLEGHKTQPRINLPFQRFGCSAGHRGLVLLPNGNVQTCGFLGPLGEQSVGKIHQEKLLTIWRRLLGSSHTDNLRAKLPDYNSTTCGPCTNCLAIALANQHPVTVQTE